MGRVLLAFGIGTLLTLFLLALAVLAGAYGMDRLASALFWQNTVLQAQAPLGNIGTEARPVMEGSPLNIVAFLASIPLGIVIYSSLAYVGLRLRGSRTR